MTALERSREASIARVKREVALGPPLQVVSRVLGCVVAVPISVGVVWPSQRWMIGVGGATLLVFLVGGWIHGKRSFHQFAPANTSGISALGRGDLAEAHQIYARWARSPHVVLSALARHNLGWTLMLEARIEDAVTLLEDTVDNYRRGLARLGMLPTTRICIALCHALLGNLDEAEAWSAKADEPVKGFTRPALPGTKAIARAVIACRRGQAADAMVVMEHAWNEHEGTMTGETLRIMRVVRAFACASADGPRNQGTVERVLGDMRPRFAHELVFLGSSWPDMATFLAAHRLDR